MKITARSTLEEVAAAVGGALKTSGIRAVLTGGGCAAIHSEGDYESEDLDLILQAAVSRKDLDSGLEKVGFRRNGDRYVHPRTRFFIEFPRGPLSIGDDLAITPVELEIADGAILALSATDSCRDRLAAFFHWRDRQSLEAAILVALKRRVNLKKIRAWSIREGAQKDFEEFEREFRSARCVRRERGRSRVR